MCEYLGVSRTVMREVLKSLEQRGLVRVINGVGTRTTDREQWKLLDPLVLSARIRNDHDEMFISHLVRVRVVLEGEMAGVAATRAIDGQLADIRAKLRELEEAIAARDVASHFRLDFEFHDLVMRASGNELARAIVLAINEEARAHLHYQRADLAQLRRAHKGHASICDALASRDSEGAEQAMREHIEGAWRLRLAGAKRQGADTAVRRR